MKLFGPSSGLQESARMVSRSFGKWFPTPAFLSPRAAGIDISDASVKWLMFSRDGRLSSWGEEPIPAGVVSAGAIRDVEALAIVLSKIKGHLHGVSYAHAALPEEAAYVFSMVVPDSTDHEQTLRMIEFEFEGRVPIPPSAAVYDYDPIAPHPDGNGMEIGVSVFPADLAHGYSDAFSMAGITLLSLEIEARSIARAVCGAAEDGTIPLVVDFGRERTGFAVVKNRVPIFTSTVAVGGDAITRALIEKAGYSEEQAVSFRNEQGLQTTAEKSPGTEAAIGAASALADEIARHYRYWDTRRDDRGERVTPVGKVILVGGSSNLKGLDDFIAARVQAPTEVGDIWKNIIRYDEYIPPIDRHHSLQYASAAGLALRAVV